MVAKVRTPFAVNQQDESLPAGCGAANLFIADFPETMLAGVNDLNGASAGPPGLMRVPTSMSEPSGTDGRLAARPAGAAPMTTPSAAAILSHHASACVAPDDVVLSR